MQFDFYKYQGTGNDFVLIDNRSSFFPKNDTELIARLCDRKFGIGADGLILLEEHPDADFRMVYFNSDGRPSSMCGNGGRCITHFANYLNVITDRAVFEAVDGMHESTISGNQVSLKMNDVRSVDHQNGYVFLDTGSPHHVQLEKELEALDVKTKGAEIRYSQYASEGANINFVEPLGESVFSVRTYERGVEDETLSCGTGVTAVAIAMFEMKNTTSEKVTLKTPGGDLRVRFTKSENGYKDIFLEGPAEMVYKGSWA